MMHIFIEKNILMEGISIVQKAIPARSSLPVLEGIYISAQNDSLLFKCCDLQMQIETSVPADVREGGAIVLPSVFCEMAGRLPDDADVELIVEDMTLKVVAGNFKTNLQGFAADQFPEMSVSKDGSRVSLEQGIFRNMIRQCIFATAQDETKPILTGALLELSDNLIEMVALDGYRLALRSQAINCSVDSRAVIPARSLNEIARSLSDSKDLVNLQFSSNQVLIDLEHTRIVARLLEGEFTKFRQILPSEHKSRIRVSRNELHRSVERALLVARENKNNLVKFTVQNDFMLINSNSELGDVYDEIPISLIGDEIEIAFNAKFFIDVLRVLDCDEIYIDFMTNVSPCVVRPVQGESFLYLILPVRLLER